MARTESDSLHVAPSDGDDYAQIEIPEGLARRTRALVGAEETPRTLGDIVHVHDETEAFVPEAFTWQDMLVAEDSRHEVLVDDERFNTYCVLDALVLPFLLDERVEIRSMPPVGDNPIEIETTARLLEARPASAVVSFGFSLDIPETRRSLDAADPASLQELLHSEACPKINAFPDRSAYEAWAAETDAVTIGLTLAQAYAMARDVALPLERSTRQPQPS